MKSYKVWNYALGVLVIAALAGCGKGNVTPAPKADAPVVTSTNPADGTKNIEAGTLSVVVNYDQNIKCSSANLQKISIDNGASIELANAYMQSLTIKLKNLEYNQSYTVTVPDGIVEGFKENQAAAKGVSVRFSTKEVQPQKHYQLDPVATLSNQNATQQAKDVYSLLLELSGKKVLTGAQSEGTANNNDHINLIYSKTGKHPALAGYDFIFLQYSPTPAGWSWVVNYSDMSAPIEHWNNGGLVNYMWHWNVPQSKEAWDNGSNNYNFDDYNFYTDKTSFSIKEALKEGTWQHDFIMQDMDKVASYLKILADAGVPVIWRPLHEAAGNYNLYGIQHNAWFWWGKGGAEPCKQLYRLMRDTFEKKHGLNNLIWVWTLDATAGAEDQWEDWYPGDDYVDIIGVDIYENNTDAKNRQYQACVDLGKGKKLVTISECGNIPNPDKCLAAGNKWSWFMVWSSDISSYPYNTDSYWKQLMQSENTLSREDLKKR